MLPLEQVQNICNPLRLKWRIANISKAPEKNKSNTHRATTLTPYQAPSQPSIDLIGPGTDISISVAAITHWTITDNPHLVFQLTTHFPPTEITLTTKGPTCYTTLVPPIPILHSSQRFTRDSGPRETHHWVSEQTTNQNTHPRYEDKVAHLHITQKDFRYPQTSARSECTQTNRILTPQSTNQDKTIPYPHQGRKWQHLDERFLLSTVTTR